MLWEVLDFANPTRSARMLLQQNLKERLRHQKESDKAKGDRNATGAEKNRGRCEWRDSNCSCIQCGGKNHLQHTFLCKNICSVRNQLVWTSMRSDALGVHACGSIRTEHQKQERQKLRVGGANLSKISIVVQTNSQTMKSSIKTMPIKRMRRSRKLETRPRQ